MAEYIATSVTTETIISGNTSVNLIANSTTLMLNSGLVKVTTGSNIGDLVEIGGLASAFDSNIDQSSYACAVKSSSNSGYIGKTFVTPTAIMKVIAYAANNVGFVSSENVTLQLYGKEGSAPANNIDGTLLAEVGPFLDINNSNPQTLIPNNISTWNHSWVTIIPSEDLINIRAAEIEFYSYPTSSLEATSEKISIGDSNINTVINSTSVSVGGDQLAKLGISAALAIVFGG